MATVKFFSALTVLRRSPAAAVRRDTKTWPIVLYPQYQLMLGDTSTYSPLSIISSSQVCYYIQPFEYLRGLETLVALPCDQLGKILPPHSPPSFTEAVDDPALNPWSPFEDRIGFDFAFYLFIELQDSAPKINRALDH